MSVSGSFLLIDSDDDADDDSSTILQVTHDSHNSRDEHGKHRSRRASKTDCRPPKTERATLPHRWSPRQQKLLQTQRLNTWRDGGHEQLPSLAYQRPHPDTQAVRHSINRVAELPPHIPDRISSLPLVPITLSSFSDPTASLAPTIKPADVDEETHGGCLELSQMGGSACHLLLNCPELCRDSRGRLCLCVPLEHAGVAPRTPAAATTATAVADMAPSAAPVRGAADGSAARERRRHSAATATFDTKVERWLAAVGDGNFNDDDDDDGATSSSARSDYTAVQHSILPADDTDFDDSRDVAHKEKMRHSLTARVEDVIVDSDLDREQRRRGIHESDAVVQAYMRLCAEEQETCL